MAAVGMAASTQCSDLRSTADHGDSCQGPLFALPPDRPKESGCAFWTLVTIASLPALPLVIHQTRLTNQGAGDHTQGGEMALSTQTVRLGRPKRTYSTEIAVIGGSSG